MEPQETHHTDYREIFKRVDHHVNIFSQHVCTHIYIYIYIYIYIFVCIFVLKDRNITHDKDSHTDTFHSHKLQHVHAQQEHSCTFTHSRYTWKNCSVLLLPSCNDEYYSNAAVCTTSRSLFFFYGCSSASTPSLSLSLSLSPPPPSPYVLTCVYSAHPARLLMKPHTSSTLHLLMSSTGFAVAESSPSMKRPPIEPERAAVGENDVSI